MTTMTHSSSKENEIDSPLLEKTTSRSIVRPNITTEITKQVIRKKLLKQRHLVIEKAIEPSYLDSIFPSIQQLFNPQTVYYNGGVAQVPEWKISSYLEVMPGGVPTTEPNLPLLHLLSPLLEECNQLFLHWYKQQHACNNINNLHARSQGRPLVPQDNQAVDDSAASSSDAAAKVSSSSSNNTNTSAPTITSKTLVCHRLMTFITRYTPAPGEQALLKHVDGAGKVDGSLVLALPMQPEAPFVGGGLTVWDGRQTSRDGKKNLLETHYETRNGDVAFLDRAVWHQADPITEGIRWALVIFYKVDFVSETM